MNIIYIHVTVQAGLHLIHSHCCLVDSFVYRGLNCVEDSSMLSHVICSCQLKDSCHSFLNQGITILFVSAQLAYWFITTIAK